LIKTAVFSTPRIKISTTDQNGVKFDSEKPRWGLLPFDALEAVVEILTLSAKKYGDRNWERGMDWHRPFDATHRHLKAFWERHDCDKESGKLELAHAACEILFLLTYQLREIGNDDRPHHKLTLEEIVRLR
jgi:hypothetical protein